MPRYSNYRKRGSPRNKRASFSRSRRGYSLSRRRTYRVHRTRGGAEPIFGAPIKYSLAGSWPSRMSLGQGLGYFKYHVGQHGGRNRRHRGGMGYDTNVSGAPLRAISHSTLPQNLRMAAHIGGIDKAIADVLPLKDQAGGRRHKSKRRCKSKRHSSSNKYMKSSRRRKSNRKRFTRRRGGSMGYAPFPNKGMLLSSSQEYAQAGLNPQWKTDVAFNLAKVRLTQ